MPMLDGKEMERRLKEILEKTEGQRVEIKTRDEDQKTNRRR